MGLDGIVSKAPYRSGPSSDWLGAGHAAIFRSSALDLEPDHLAGTQAAAIAEAEQYAHLVEHNPGGGADRSFSSFALLSPSGSKLLAV